MASILACLEPRSERVTPRQETYSGPRTLEEMRAAYLRRHPVTAPVVRLPEKPTKPKKARPYIAAPTPKVYGEFALSGRFISRKVSVAAIIGFVADYYGRTADELTGERKFGPLIEPRQVAVFLAWDFTSQSLPELGRRFGGRDHTTILYSLRAIQSKASDNPRIAAEISKLRARMES